MSDKLTSEEAKNSDDSRILKSIWKLLDECDVVVGHNCFRFDRRKLNARFIINFLPPPSPYKTVDTLKECKKHFAFTGYKLDYLVKLFGLGEKISTSYDLWLKCINGDIDALEKMEKYNKNDVIINEDLFMKIRGWIGPIYNYALYTETDKKLCPTCGNENIVWNGYYYTTVGRFRSGKCNSCNTIFRSRYSDLSKSEKKNILVVL